MESKLKLKKIVMILAFTSLISFACLLSSSKSEKDQEVETDDFSFAEPRLKDDPSYYEVDLSSSKSEKDQEVDTDKFSLYEEGPEVETDYFSFAEPRLKDDPRYYQVDEYDESVYIYDDDDDEVAIVVIIDYGDTSNLRRQLNNYLDDIDFRGESNPRNIRVGGFPALITTVANDDGDWDYSFACQIVIVDLQEEADDEVYLFIRACSYIDDRDEIEAAQEIFDEDVEPMLDIILDTLEFFDLDRY